MGVGIEIIQLKPECKENLIKQMTIIKDYFYSYEKAENAIKDRDKIFSENTLSRIYYPGFYSDDIVMILNKDKYSEYDKSKFGYWAVYGKVENEISNPDAHVSYLEKDDIKFINKEIERLKLIDKENFESYFTNLSLEIRKDLNGEWDVSKMNKVDYFYDEVKNFYDFYKDCENNESWVFIYLC